MAAKAFTASVSQPDEFRGPAYPPQGQWTYEDYLRLPDDGRRYEVLRGVLYVSAAPVPLHQIILRRFVRVLLFFLEENPIGELLFAPVDVMFPAGLATPVQPDLLFITAERTGIIKDRNIEGAPDLVLEVLSPSTRRLDRKTKFDIYAEAGVREYWLADPLARTVEVFVLRDGAYALLGKFGRGERLRSEVIPGFEPSLGEIFKD
jgi:Uma2 family endonuclease